MADFPPALLPCLFIAYNNTAICHTSVCFSHAVRSPDALAVAVSGGASVSLSQTSVAHMGALFSGRKQVVPVTTPEEVKKLLTELRNDDANVFTGKEVRAPCGRVFAPDRVACSLEFRHALPAFWAQITELLMAYCTIRRESVRARRSRLPQPQILTVSGNLGQTALCSPPFTRACLQTEGLRAWMAAFNMSVSRSVYVKAALALLLESENVGPNDAINAAAFARFAQRSGFSTGFRQNVHCSEPCT